MSASKPTEAQIEWLSRGLGEPGGKLPLFDGLGRAIDPRTIKACLKAGWAEPWRRNPVKPDWLVCRLTDAGKIALATARAETESATPAPHR